MTIDIFTAGGPFRNVMEISQLDGDFAGGLKVGFSRIANTW